MDLPRQAAGIPVSAIVVVPEVPEVPDHEGAGNPVVVVVVVVPDHEGAGGPVRAVEVAHVLLHVKTVALY